MHNTPVHARLHLQRPATLASLPDLMQALQDICRQAGLTEEPQQDFRVAVEEASVNIIHHAYAGQTTGVIEMDVVWSDDEGKPAIKCMLRDHGPPFNPLNQPLPDITVPAEERAIGGLGVLLVRQMSDRVEWHYGSEDSPVGNCLTLIKYLQLPA
jgi:serine/threonine-protein kinase RsbW